MRSTRSTPGAADRFSQRRELCGAMGRPDLNPAVIIDNGTGFTKMGLSGNVKPSYIIPTCVGYGTSPAAVRRSGGIEDLDFAIGYDALAKTDKYSITYPIKHGLVEDWDAMERYWQQCLYSYLRTDPEDHYFVLTEPPLNPPENREETAEIMFETFGVAGLFIGVQVRVRKQAVLALAGSNLSEKITGSNRSIDSLTGTVVDSGDGVTHVIPVSDGYVVGSCIKSIPIAGKDITQFVHQLMRERGEKIPPESSMAAAQRVKENHCYVCNDIVKEFGKYDDQPQKYFKQISGETRKTKQTWSADVGYEQFLAPEVFFSPEIAGTGEFFTPLPEIVDTAISQAPIDCRRKLYGNIVLSGGSTLFKDFGRRLQRDITRLVKKRVAKSHGAAGSATAPGGDASPGQSVAPDVYVASHPTQRFAVWFGGTVIASTSQFSREVHTKADYDEYGPSICRSNPVSAGLV